MTTLRKNNKSNVNNVTITEDYLASLNDDDLRSIFLQTRSWVNKAKRNKKFKNILKEKEIDMCYIQKEMQNRKYYRK